MVSNAVTVIVPIKAGEEAHCRAVLEQINQVDGVRIDFARNNLTHFARYGMIADVESGRGRQRLLFSAIHDGSRDAFLRDMRDSTSDIDAIWSYCEGYPGKSGFVEFLKQNDNRTNLHLKGYRYETVGDIQKYIALREELTAKFDVPLAQHEAVLNSLPHQFPLIAWFRKGWRLLSTLLRNLAITISLIPEMIGLLRYGLLVFRAGLIMLRPIALDREYSDAPLDRSGPCEQFAPGDEVAPCKEVDSLPPFRAGQTLQNQVNLITVSLPEAIQQKYAILDMLGWFIKIPFVNRNQTIPTIHYGRWLMIDEGRRMLFMSEYDGSALAYIADFVNRLPNELDGLWGESYGWRRGATLDPEAFLDGILCHNTPSIYHYSAYPLTTVVSIGQARDLYHAYHENINAETAKRWLRYL